jgi:hypothetical protein
MKDVRRSPGNAKVLCVQAIQVGHVFSISKEYPDSDIIVNAVMLLRDADSYGSDNGTFSSKNGRGWRCEMRGRTRSGKSGSRAEGGAQGHAWTVITTLHERMGGPQAGLCPFF